MDLINTVKQHFLSKVDTADPKYKYLYRHIPLVEKWANKILQSQPQANAQVVLLSVWLHDIGIVVGTHEDHAVNSEIEAKRFLTEFHVEEAIIEQVAHCVRAHRCRDVQPATLEAKILATADSASHLTDIVYIDMSNRGEKDAALAKLERDLRDVGLFPELQKEITPLWEAWHKLLEVYPAN